MPYAPKILSSKKHLVLVRQEGWIALEDFHEIQKRIEQQAPDIKVFITDNQNANTKLLAEASKQPTLVVSPSQWLSHFRPRRGRVDKGESIPKTIQLARLKEASIPVPKWELITPDFQPREEDWGSHLIIKTADSSSGLGENISIVATKHYRYRRPEDYPDGHRGQKTPMLAQRFIETGKRVTQYRVCTLYGEALYCQHQHLVEPMPDLASITEEIFSDTIATNIPGASRKVATLVDAPDVVELAKKCHRCFPTVPVMGIDILRDTHTDYLFVLELNCAGNTWHISSDHSRDRRTGNFTKDKIVAQFGAWDVAAQVLIKNTRLLAK